MRPCRYDVAILAMFFLFRNLLRNLSRLRIRCDFDVTFLTCVSHDKLNIKQFDGGSGPDYLIFDCERLPVPFIY